MTLYATFLLAALEDEPAGPDLSIAAQVARVMARRAAVAGDGSTGPFSSADRVNALLAYDAALVRLCQQLGIDHHFFGPESPDVARRLTEKSVAARMPGLAAGLGWSGHLEARSDGRLPASRSAGSLTPESPPGDGRARE